MNEKIKTGFSAYEEIETLAKRAFPSRDVRVISAICADDYLISVDGKDVAAGSTAEVRRRLNQALILLDRKVQP